MFLTPLYHVLPTFLTHCTPLVSTPRLSDHPSRLQDQSQNLPLAYKTPSRLTDSTH